jgi:glyoxylase-like metal-dependent hydrolase (beta-lactamase superfamily II)
MAAAAGTALVAAAILSGARMAAQQAADSTLHTVHVQGKVYMIVGDGGNVTIQVGDSGVFVIDTGTAAQAPALIAEIRKVAGSKPIRWILNTTIDADHIGGNVAVKKAGEQIVAGNFAGQVGQGEGAAIVGRQELLDWMSEPTGTGSATMAPSDAWPTEAYTEPHDDFFFNDEAIMAIHAPAAHTAGDSLVFFRRSDVLVAGDTFIETTFPVIDTKHGGTINGILDALNQIIDITVPDHQEEGGTLVIAGHGRLCDEADVVDYRDMVTIIRDRVQDMIKKGMTVEQVVAAGPAQDYADRYGATSGPWTTTQFVQAVYQTLKPVVAAATPAPAKVPARKK